MGNLKCATWKLIIMKKVHGNDDREETPNIENIIFKGFKVTSTYGDEGNSNNLVYANNVDRYIGYIIY